MVSVIQGQRQLLVFLLLVATSIGVVVSAINIDVTVPTVVSSGVEGESQGFGFSLAQHELSDGRKITLVGAPKVNSSLRPEEGGFYSCPFVNGGTCQFENVSQSLENSNPDLFVFPLSTDDVSYIGQLMGYSLKSFGDYIVACAPLYIHSLTEFTALDSIFNRGDPNGRCVIIDRDLDPSSVLQLSSSDLSGGALRLAGLDITSLNVTGVDHIALGSGFSGESNKPLGQVFLKELNRTSGGYGSDITLSSVSGAAPVLSLTGYRLDTGYFTVGTAGPQQIVTSAPRSLNHFGKIEILTIGDQLNVAHTIQGKEADGYYGYDFAVVDFGTEGGYHSIVVGCPLCDRERGRVYIYTHTGDISNPDPFIESTISAPSSSVPGRFGMAVSNIGDVDQDGLSDVAISAPYEGSGVVYVFRGSQSGLVTNDYEVIPATPNSQAFGYSLSGGLDIDDNGYPDLSVSDLSGNHVTSFRAVPLVNVTLLFRDVKDVLDLVGETDRLCPLNENVNLQCFNVTPCFYYEAKHGNVAEFALTYTLTVDSSKGRVGLYQQNNGAPIISENIVSDTISIPGSGPENQICPQTYTFALRADFTETAPIPVLLSVSDSPNPLALESDPVSEQLGGPLHPVLMRYVRGNEPAPLSLEHEVFFNVNCTGGNSETECEPFYQLDVEDNPSPRNEPVLILASGNEFGYRIDVTNTAVDDGLNPTLVVQFPQGVLYNRAESISSSAITECNTRVADKPTDSAIECELRNPIRAGKKLEMVVYFLLNVSALSLESEELSFNFSVTGSVDGNRPVQVRSVRLDAVGAYSLNTLFAESSYKALRRTFFQNSSTLPLNETGPLVNFRIIALNGRHESNGTAIAQSTLYVYFPVEVVVDGKSKPLLIPTEIVALGNVNCSHYRAIPEGLSDVQVPTSFVPPWTGPRPRDEPRCELSGQYKCGVIICTVRDLAPLPAPPTQLTILSRLFSPSVTFNKEVGVFSFLSNNNELPRLGEDSRNSSEAFFDLLPAVTEVARDCIPYWIVVVSVVIGIFALVIIITVLGFCGIFRRWYKVKQEEATWERSNGNDHIDSDYVYHRRTIPPIPGLTSTSAGNTLTGKEREKDMEAEAEAEAEQEREKMQLEELLASPSEPKESLEKFTFDPSKGVDDGIGGEETEL